MKSWRAAELIERFGGRLVGNPEAQFDRIATLIDAKPGAFSFLANPKYRSQLSKCKASVIVLREADLGCLPAGATAIVVDSPYHYYARVSGLFEAPTPEPVHHATAIIDPSAQIGKAVHLGPHVVIGKNAQIGDGAILHSGVIIEENAKVGALSVLHPHVVVYYGCEIGARCIVHAGAVIGADGFGFAPAGDSGWQKIEQLGRVLIGDDVEIGANTTIDRGAIGDTVIERGCKLDNQIQIAHNVRIGEFTVMAACVGVAGSAVIGKRCMIGGSAGILGHLEIADGVTISAMSLVTRSISEPGMYSGTFPLMANRDWERSAVLVRQLDSLRNRVKALESRREETE